MVQTILVVLIIVLLVPVISLPSKYNVWPFTSINIPFTLKIF